MRKILVAAAAAISLSALPCGAVAATTPAAGYLYTRDVLGQLTEGCIAQAPGGVFAGVGPMLSFPAPGGTRSILFLSESGAVRTVAVGLNSISDCSYDVAADVLYVTDSGLEFSGATTGDTVFAIPGDSDSAPVTGMEVLPAGSIPYAFGIDFTPTGLMVTDAAGGGAGRVVAIDMGGLTPSMTTFASGFDYTGGVLVEAAHVFVAEAVEPSFESAISRYSSAGAFEALASGPTYGHGSVDLGRTRDGNLVVSGAPTLVAVDDLGATTSLVTGLDGGTGFDAFGGGVSVNAFTGRIDFLASSFSGADDDKAVHHLVPVERLVSGGGSTTTDCAMEIYGVELVPRSPGMAARAAICTDGAACDADGVADGACTFPVGVCLNADDPRLADCTSPGIASVELLSVTPAAVEMEDMTATLSSELPSTSPTCVFSDGLRVPVRVLSSGATRAGKGKIKLRATTSAIPAKKDTDVVRLVCEPALP